MNIIKSFLYLFLVFSFIEAREFKDEDLHDFPKLFHLDDYDRCLSQRNGMYCLASFHLIPTQEPHRTYDLMKKYSSYRHNYNRTFIHRGYCVSTRCPKSTIANDSSRFQNCVDALARANRLKATLHRFHYCHHHKKSPTMDDSMDAPKYIFLYIIYGLLCMNIIGTAYDVFGGRKKCLLSWSIKSNWRQIISTADYNHIDPRQECLRPNTGAKFILSLIVVFAHTGMLHSMVFLQNPRDLEASTSEWLWLAVTNGPIIVQFFVIISSCLSVYNFILDAEKKELNYGMIPKKVFKRIIRIAPTHLLIVGFCATWWIDLGDGPLWWSIVGKQRDICRKKFWSHLVSINNIVDGTETCQIQTWFMAIIMQMYVVSLVLTVFLAPLGRRAIPILLAMFAFSCVGLSIVSYILGWQSLVVNATPEVYQAYAYGGASLGTVYISPLGSVPVCIMGSFIAHLQYELQKSEVQLQNWRLFNYLHYLGIPAFIFWVDLGKYIRDTSNELFAVGYIGIERFVIGIISTIQSIGIINTDSWFRHFLSWRGWKPFNTISLAVMMTHWCLNVTIVAMRPQPLTISTTSIIVDATATFVLSHLISVPITLLVEIPMRRFLDSVIK